MLIIYNSIIQSYVELEALKVLSFLLFAFEYDREKYCEGKMKRFFIKILRDFEI